MSGHAHCQLEGVVDALVITIMCRVNPASGAWLLQNSIQSNASARGALAGLRWGSETEIQPAMRSDSEPVAAAGAAAVTTSAAADDSAADDGLATALAPQARLAAAGGDTAAVDDWGQHPKSLYGSVASLAGKHACNVLNVQVSLIQLVGSTIWVSLGQQLDNHPMCCC